MKPSLAIMTAAIREVLGDQFIIEHRESEDSAPQIRAIPIVDGETQIVTLSRDHDPLSCESVGSDLWIAVRAYACGLRDQRHVSA